MRLFDFLNTFSHIYFLSWNVFLCSKDASRRGLSIDIELLATRTGSVSNSNTRRKQSLRVNVRILPPARRTVHVRVRVSVSAGL